MAKKTRRARKSSRPAAVRRVSEQRREEMPARAAVATPKTPAAPVTRGVSVAQAMANIREEYHYVLNDLKRLGIIALVMFAALIVLSFVLT